MTTKPKLTKAHDQYSEGQSLWFEPSDRRDSSCAVTVTKVARKWVSIGYRGRFDAVTGWVDGGQYSSPGKIWVSREAADLEKQRNSAWEHLARRIQGRWTAPEGVTADHIRQAEALLYPELGRAAVNKAEG